MGVTGLWTVVAPTARPTKLETLNRKRLAVDASIWIYQFLKAVRDKEGNALRNSHVVGFFRRICKLLYFGIKPVFVFDGGAPTLKRETVRSRARRREGRREDAVRTAGKLLAVQVARAAEEEEKRRKETRQRTPIEEELPADKDLVYVDEIGMTQKERQAGRGFKRKDQYHLPDLDVSIESLGAPNDPRIMSQAELEEYARQFHQGEDINLYDFSKIDFESPFFMSLPPGDRYNILNAARLRSRLRMGYSKEQLDGMFPDRLAFSKFQIERVKERNELTQRLMHINGMSESWDQGGRIVGEKGKEYVLVKNDGVEGGWALGVVSNKGSRKEEAIDLEEDQASDDMKEESEEDDFEDVAIEGLNRLPKSLKRKNLREVDYDISYEDAAAQIARKREAVYGARRKAAEKEAKSKTVAPNSAEVPEPSVPADTLFVPNESDSENDLFEDVDISVHDEDDDLQRAIAMSLEQPEGDELEDQDNRGDITFAQATSNSELDDGGFDLNTALAESRKSKYQSKTNVRAPTTFDGPLPFESLNLGQSLLGKKKVKQLEEDNSGGFDRNGDQPKRKAQPLPSWFDATSNDDGRRNDLNDIGVMEERTNRPKPNKHHQIIDLEADDKGAEAKELYVPDEEPIETTDLAEDIDDTEDLNHAEKEKAAQEREERYKIAREIAAENQDIPNEVPESNSPPTPSKPTKISEDLDSELKLPQDTTEASMNDIATPIRIDQRLNNSRSNSTAPSTAEVDWSESENEEKPAAVDFQDVDDENEVFEDVDTRHAVNLPNADEDDEAFEDVDMNFVPDPVNIEAPPQEDYLVDAHPDQDDNYFSDSDDELMRQLAVEAEEHARFASELNANKTQAEARRDYENELKQLRNQQKKDRRDADEVTQVMIQECQALLRLFGLPYITAPMEAEAQCAELVHLGLVDGIVTDDSDIFLFGGTRIYKNMFNAAKFVECYLSSDLEKEYALDRQKLIRFAHLLGSDYTDGIPGIGPVTALEIISDFSSLEEFKDWCSRVQLGRPQDLENQLTTPFRRKFKRTVQKKLFLPTAFPDLRVDHAYLSPEVDSDPEEFQWGVPDLDKLRGFLMATIGWNQDRTDEILVPVIRDINKREQEGTQANITRFFSGSVGIGAKEGTAPRNRTGKESGRMKNAYTRLRGEAKRQADADEDEVEKRRRTTTDPS